MAAGLVNGNIELYNKEGDEYKHIATLEGHLNPVSSVAFHCDGKQIASGSEDKRIGIWDIEKHKNITMLKGHSSSVWSVSWSPDGNQIASGSWDNSIGIWHNQNQQKIKGGVVQFLN